MGRLLILVAAAAVAQSASAFYLPGVAPQDYARDDLVNFKVRRSAGHGGAARRPLAWWRGGSVEGARGRLEPDPGFSFSMPPREMWSPPPAGELAVKRKERSASGVLQPAVLPPGDDHPER